MILFLYAATGSIIQWLYSFYFADVQLKIDCCCSSKAFAFRIRKDMYYVLSQLESLDTFPVLQKVTHTYEKTLSLDSRKVKAVH